MPGMNTFDLLFLRIKPIVLKITFKKPKGRFKLPISITDFRLG